MENKKNLLTGLVIGGLTVGAITFYCGYKFGYYRCESQYQDRFRDLLRRVKYMETGYVTNSTFLSHNQGCEY